MYYFTKLFYICFDGGSRGQEEMNRKNVMLKRDRDKEEIRKEKESGQQKRRLRDKVQETEREKTQRDHTSRAMLEGDQASRQVTGGEEREMRGERELMSVKEAHFCMNLIQSGLKINHQHKKR